MIRMIIFAVLAIALVSYLFYKAHQQDKARLDSQKLLAEELEEGLSLNETLNDEVRSKTKPVVNPHPNFHKSSRSRGPKGVGMRHHHDGIDPEDIEDMIETAAAVAEMAHMANEALSSRDPEPVASSPSPSFCGIGSDCGSSSPSYDSGSSYDSGGDCGGGDCGGD